jgi:hypothetical protein
MAQNNRKYSPSSDLIPLNGVAEQVCNVSGKTFLRWYRGGEMNIPDPVVINGRRYFRRDEIEIWKRKTFEGYRIADREYRIATGPRAAADDAA